jgi:uncharacterized protein YjbJ (UPF0337 family)
MSTNNGSAHAPDFTQKVDVKGQEIHGKVELAHGRMTDDLAEQLEGGVNDHRSARKITRCGI